MLKPEEWMTIKTLSKKGVSQRQIARMLRISRNTVKKQLAEEHPPQYRRSAPYPSILDEYKDYLLERLQEYPTLTANRLYRELQTQGYTGSYETVVIFARKHRVKKDPQAYERFETSPGQQAQVDWGECSNKIDHFGVRRKVYLFSMTLGFSRVQYIEFTLDMKMPTLMRCLLKAFRYFGGIPQELLFDNMKTVVDEHIGDHVRFNERFLDFANHYGFLPKATRVCYPEGKGKVERSIQYVWTSFYTGRKFDSLAQMNNEARDWLENVCNSRVHGTTGARPLDRLAEERTRLQAVRQEEYDICDIKVRKVRKDCYFSYKQNFYSVPHTNVGKTVQVKIYADELKVYDGITLIATHRICLLRNQFIKDPLHFKGIIRRRRRGSIESYRQRFSGYSDIGVQFINSSIEECQPNPYYHWKRILDLAEEYPAESVITALRHCLDYKVFSFAIFRNVLSRLPVSRESQPSMVTVCGRCREDLPTDVTRPLAYYDIAMPASN